MAKKCASATILETLRDPRVVTMAPAAQLVWIRVITAMQNSQISVLKFGSDIMNRSGIALFIQVAESEVETHLQTIIDRGLLTRDDDGAISCPMLVQAATRAEINRINGSKGGRPRKDASRPVQPSLMLSIPGGGTETKITERETEMVTEGAQNPTYLLKESSSESKVSSVSVSSEAFQKAGRAAFEAAGFDPARSMANWGIVRQWLADGADEALIVDVITRKRKPGITTLAYFTKAIAEAIQTKPPTRPQWKKRYDAAMSDWELFGRGVSPMPRLEDFQERDVA
jgi:hypothetical protein